MAQFIYILFALCLFNHVKELSNNPGEKAIKRRLISLISPKWPKSELKTSQETNFLKLMIHLMSSLGKLPEALSL